MRFPNGFGGVCKLSGNRRRPWMARITTGWTKSISKKTGKETSRQIYQIIGYFEEKKDALDALTKHRIQPVSPKANITFEELYKEWSKSKYEYISRQTTDNYKAGWKYLSKYGKAQFKELRTAHLQGIVDSCFKNGLSRSTLQKIKIVASMLYDYAIQNDMANKNYADYIQIPKQEKQEKEPFTDLEVKKIIDNAGKIEWVDTILIMIYTGLRISEMLELTKFNIDMENQLITGGIKTEAGKNRIIPIHPIILPYIKKWYDIGGERLICNSNKRPISTRKYRKDYYMPAIEALGIRKLNPHSCRHTFASMLSKAGASTKAIQKIIGHSDYSTTANIYTHPDIDELRKAISLI